MALKINAKFEGKLTSDFKNDMKNLANFHKLKNSDSILDSKNAEVNQNKNLKEVDQPDSVRKLYFTLEIFHTCSTESLFLRYKKVSDFLQCSVHIFLGHDGYF